MELYTNYNRVHFGYEEAVEELQEEIAMITKMIDGYEKATPEEKYALLNHFFDIRFTKGDQIKLINKILGTSFNTTVKLPTKMEIKDVASEGHGRDFSWWTVFYRILIEAAIIKGSEFEDRTYSREEILELIEQGIIYPLRLKADEIHKLSEDHEDYKEIPTFDPDVIDFEKHEWSGNWVVDDAKGKEELLVGFIEESYPYKKLLHGVKTYVEGMIQDAKDNEDFISKEEVKLIEKVKSLIQPKPNKKGSKKKS